VSASAPPDASHSGCQPPTENNSPSPAVGPARAHSAGEPLNETLTYNDLYQLTDTLRGVFPESKLKNWPLWRPFGVQVDWRNSFVFIERIL